MKFAVKTLLLCAALVATLASAQNNNLKNVQHVVVVIQENRTPDNLFQQDQALINNGAHIASQGLCLTPSHSQVQVQLSPAPLGTCWDPDHSNSHSPGPGFEGADHDVGQGRDGRSLSDFRVRRQQC